jgi:two-component system cell cycle response regulator
VTGYVAFATVLLTAYTIAVVTDAPETVTAALSLIAMFAGLAAMLYGIRRHRPASRWPWLLVAGQVLVLVSLAMPLGVMAGGPDPTPAAGDAVLLTGNATGALALLLIVRRRSPGWDLPGLIDAGIITVAAGLLSWIYVVDPLVGNTPDRWAGTVAAAYPLTDLLLAALGARLLLDRGPKPVAVRCLTGYLALIIVPDTMSVFATLTGDQRWQAVAFPLWTASALLIGMTGMHPSLRDVDAPVRVVSQDLGPGRLAALAIASLLAPAALFVQYLRGAHLHIPLVCASCGVLFLLVIGRLAGVVAVQRRMAVTDELTGLRTRRFFQGALHGPARPTAVVLLDVDHFKQVNDTYGHDGGDRVLREVARRIGGAVRLGDVVARYGGEEFAVLLPNATPEEALTVAGRMHAAVRGAPIAVSDSELITVTVSAGVACSPPDRSEPGALPLVADRFLYEAKNAGRDRVAGPA